MGGTDGWVYPNNWDHKKGCMMDHEPGREPTEPTDAAAEAIEVLRQRFARWWHEVGSGIAPMALEEWPEHAKRVARAAWCDGAFLSGARPMPAPTAIVYGLDPALPNAEYTAGYCTRCNTPVYHRLGKPGEYDHECTLPDTPAPDEVAQLRAEVAKPITAAFYPRGHGKTTRVIQELAAKNTALTARVADLERENAALGAEVNNARRLAGEGGVA